MPGSNFSFRPRFACATPSTEPCVLVVSYMGSSFSLVVFLAMAAPRRGAHRSSVARRRGSCRHPVLEVRDAGGLDGTDLLEPHLRVPEVVEEASTVAEQYWNDVELELVQ
jgi:hypothetical protein